MSKRSSALETLRANGIKATPQRQAILEVVKQPGFHPRADEVFEAVRRRYPSMSRATVYNTLNMLAEKGLVQPLQMKGGHARFCARRDPHYHVVCETCGRIEDVPMESLKPLESQAAEHTGYKVLGHRMEFFGICKKCRPAEA